MAFSASVRQIARLVFDSVLNTIKVSVTDSGNTISVNNNRAAATLAAGAIFQGVSDDVSSYGRVGVAVKSDNASNGTLVMEVSHDNVNWGGPSRIWQDTRFAQPHMWNIVEKYFRIKYINGGIEALNLSIQVQYSNNADIILGHQLDENLTDETEALATKTVIVGRDSDGLYKNVELDRSRSLRVNSRDIASLLEELLTETKRSNQYLRIISGDELLEENGDL